MLCNSNSMIVCNVVREYFPGVSDEEAMYIVWNDTGFPCFWPSGPGTNAEKFELQLMEAKRLADLEEG